MFDSCDRGDDRFANSEFDRYMTIGLQTGMDTVFAYRFANRSSCVNALLVSPSRLQVARQSYILEVSHIHL